MTNKPLKKGATYDDLRRVPDHYVAEMFDGELYASPRPALPHARAATKLAEKLRIYAREGVAHAWLVDPLRRSLEVLALESGSLEQIEEHHGDSSVRARPFDAIELELRSLWI